jgi:hypothetical protein
VIPGVDECVSIYLERYYVLKRRWSDAEARATSGNNLFMSRITRKIVVYRGVQMGRFASNLVQNPP